MNWKIIGFLSIFICQFSYGQVADNQNFNQEMVEKDSLSPLKFKTLNVSADLEIPKDSLVRKALLLSVDGFLAAAQANDQNQWVLPVESLETQILIDEIQDIQKSEAFDKDTFYKAYLTNITPLEANQYAVQIAYLGIHENVPFLNANFELIAHPSKDNFLITSPLKRNTQNWAIKKVQNHVFHYPYDLKEVEVENFANHIVFCDEKLENNKGETHYYLCKKENDPLKLFGVAYKSDYNGEDLNTRWSTENDQKTLWVLNESLIYHSNTHDLWHNRIGRVISRKKINRRVDCQIATLYGGIWGKSWQELFPMFCEKFVVSDQVDWLKHMKDKSHFLTFEKRKNYMDDFVGALIVKQIEAKQGFDGVWKLLKIKGRAEYFATLEDLVGISEETYNKEVQKLIRAEMKVLGI